MVEEIYITICTASNPIGSLTKEISRYVRQKIKKTILVSWGDNYMSRSVHQRTNPTLITDEEDTTLCATEHKANNYAHHDLYTRAQTQHWSLMKEILRYVRQKIKQTVFTGWRDICHDLYNRAQTQQWWLMKKILRYERQMIKQK